MRVTLSKYCQGRLIGIIDYLNLFIHQTCVYWGCAFQSHPPLLLASPCRIVHKMGKTSDRKIEACLLPY